MKLTYANVVSTLCLFILLGGGAYAATHLPRNSVGPRQLKKNSVSGAKVKNHSLTGDDIDVSTLNVSSGFPPGPFDYIHGNGRVLVGRKALKEGQKEVLLFEIPQIGTLSGECSNLGANFEVATKSTQPIDYTYTSGVAGPPPAHDGGTISAPGSPLILGEDQYETFVIQLATQTTPTTVATVTASLHHQSAKCTLFAQAVVADDGPVAVP